MRVATEDLVRLRKLVGSLRRVDGKKISVVEIMSAAVWQASHLAGEDLATLLRQYLADQVRLALPERGMKRAK